MFLVFSLVAGPNRPLVAQTSSTKPTSAYNLFFPIESDGSFDSDVAYIPEELLNELFRGQSKKQENETINRFRLELKIVDSELAGAMGMTELTTRIEMAIEEIGNQIRWPLNIGQTRFARFRVDGNEIPLGGRLKWDDQFLEWLR